LYLGQSFALQTSTANLLYRLRHPERRFYRKRLRERGRTRIALTRAKASRLKYGAVAAQAVCIRRVAKHLFSRRAAAAVAGIPVRHTQSQMGARFPALSAMVELRHRALTSTALAALHQTALKHPKLRMAAISQT
jgi:hypothetical protein